MEYVEIFGLWVLKVTMLGNLHMKAIHGQVTYTVKSFTVLAEKICLSINV